MSDSAIRALTSMRVCLFIPFTKLCEAYGADAAYLAGQISEQAPFGWGGNNRTLVSAKRLGEHIACSLEPEDAEPIDNMLQDLKVLDDFCIDMEN